MDGNLYLRQDEALDLAAQIADAHVLNPATADVVIVVGAPRTVVLPVVGQDDPAMLMGAMSVVGHARQMIGEIVSGEMLRHLNSRPGILQLSVPTAAGNAIVGTVIIGSKDLAAASQLAQAGAAYFQERIAPGLLAGRP